MLVHSPSLHADAADVGHHLCFLCYRDGDLQPCRTPAAAPYRRKLADFAWTRNTVREYVWLPLHVRHGFARVGALGRIRQLTEAAMMVDIETKRLEEKDREGRDDESKDDDGIVDEGMGEDEDEDGEDEGKEQNEDGEQSEGMDESR